MKRDNGTATVATVSGAGTAVTKTPWVAAAGCAALLAAGVAAWGQESSGSNNNESRGRQSDAVKSGRAEPPGAPRPRSGPPVPEAGPPVPIPRYDPPPLGGRDRLPDPPPPRERPRPGSGGGSPDVTGGGDERSAVERARDAEADARDRHGLDRPDSDRRRGGRGDHDDHHDHDGYDRRRRRPLTYYEPWVYDDRRYYDDGYRGNEPPTAPEPATAQEAADGPAGERPGALLPPDELMEDPDTPAALRKALEASPQYREATAQLLRAWATYARAAEQVLLRLRPAPEYRKAMQQLRAAEKKVEAVRERDRGAPAVNLVSAAQEALLARRQVRAIEQKAIDADPVARRARQEVDKAIDHRNKIRDDIASTVPAEEAK